ncbi:MAG: hypothetical protein ABSG51_06070 [Terracidiphilus sp.]|jgi:hypothetical protein
MDDMTIKREWFVRLVDRYLLIENEEPTDLQSLRDQWEQCETPQHEAAFFMRLVIFLDHRKKASIPSTHI